MRKRTLRTWVEISKVAVLHNVSMYRKILPKSTDIMAVVKSNAYGHGMVNMAKLLERSVSFFAVVFIEEALELRESGIRKPILVLSTVTFNKETLEEAIRKHITFTVYDDESYRRISNAARSIQKTAAVHINTDTGMTRLGFNKNRYEEVIAGVCGNSHLTIQGLYSHLSSADSDLSFTRKQCEQFEKAVEAAERVHCDIRYKHLLNTPGVMLGIHAGNIARIGLGLFGLPPSDLSMREARKIYRSFKLKPALSWKTRVIQVRQVGKNTDVGYGRSYRTKKETIIATIPVGFADGYSRALSNKGAVLIQGTRCPVRGNVCMNNLMVEVPGVENVKPGDEVVLIGSDSRETITVAEIAKQRNTNPAEVVTAISENIPRLY